MRVWYVSKYGSKPNSPTGASRGYLLNKALAEMGHQVVYVSAETHPETSVSFNSRRVEVYPFDGMTICNVKISQYSRARSIKRVFTWLEFEWRVLFLPKTNLVSPDVIVASSLSILTILNGLVLRRRFKCRLVFEVRDIWPLTLTEEGGFGKLNPAVLLLGWVEKIGYARSDAVIGTMPNLKPHVVSRLGYEKDVYCLPMGIGSIQEYNPHGTCMNAHALPAELNEKFIVCHAGSIGGTNALETLFSCANLLIGNDKIHFLIVGDGDLRSNFVSRFGNLPNITFIEKVSKGCLPKILEQCDVLYFSTFHSKVWNYGQSLNKLIDYMAAGKPIIGSFSGFPSMVNEAESGSFVAAENPQELKNEIEKYSQMSGLDLSKMGKRGQEWLLKHRTYSVLAEKYSKILNSVH